MRALLLSRPWPLLALLAGGCSVVIGGYDFGEEGAGTCVAELFHAGFDDGQHGAELLESGDIDPVPVPEPTRHGAGAWKIETVTGSASFLVSTAVDQEDTPYWFGFSNLYQGGIELCTALVSLGCTFEDDTGRNLFALGMDHDSPNLPFLADTLPLPDPEQDDLGQIERPEGWVDWVLAFDVSRGEGGYFEVYHEGQRVYRVSGKTVDDACVTYQLYVGLQRCHDETYPDLAQTVVLDEVTLLRGDIAPLDALYTLDPDSGCFDP